MKNSYTWPRSFRDAGMAGPEFMDTGVSSVSQALRSQVPGS